MLFIISFIFFRNFKKGTDKDNLFAPLMSSKLSLFKSQNPYFIVRFIRIDDYRTMGKGEPHAKKFVTLLHQIISVSRGLTSGPSQRKHNSMGRQRILHDQRHLTFWITVSDYLFSNQDNTIILPTSMPVNTQLNMYSFRNKIVGKKQRIWFRQNFSRDG